MLQLCPCQLVFFKLIKHDLSKTEQNRIVSLEEMFLLPGQRLQSVTKLRGVGNRYALPCPGTVAVPLCDMPKRGRRASFEFPALLRGETVPDEPPEDM